MGSDPILYVLFMNTHSHTVAVFFFLGTILCALYWFSGGDKDIQSLIPHRSQIVIEKGIRKDAKTRQLFFVIELLISGAYILMVSAYSIVRVSY